MTESGENMGQLTALVEAICKDFRGHDKGEIRRLVEWQRVMRTRGATRATASRAWTARWAGPHRAIPGHAMKSVEET